MDEWYERQESAGLENQGGVLPDEQNERRDVANGEDAVAAPVVEIANLTATVGGSQDRFYLSESERFWAKSIKEAVEADPELDNLSDFWYVQLALIEQHNIQGAVERARGLQHFREEYSIRDTLEEGQTMIWRTIQLMPRHLLAYTYNPHDDIHVLIIDMTEFNMSVLSNPEKVQTWLAGVFYLVQALCEDFKTIRRGFHMFCECEGYSFGSGVKLSIIQKVYTEFVNYYPFKPHEIKHFNTGVIFHTVASMMRRFMPEELQKAWILGCRYNKRLDTIYMIPTVEASNKRVMERLSASLKQRYMYESSFRL